MTLIPKKHGYFLELGNWTLITLLNVDLKIASKAIAKRLEPVLFKVIHPDQTGFVKDIYRREQKAYIRCEGIHQSARYTWNIIIVRLSQGL